MEEDGLKNQFSILRNDKAKKLGNCFNTFVRELPWKRRKTRPKVIGSSMRAANRNSRSDTLNLHPSGSLR